MHINNLEVIFQITTKIYPYFKMEPIYHVYKSIYLMCFKLINPSYSRITVTKIENKCFIMI